MYTLSYTLINSPSEQSLNRILLHAFLLTMNRILYYMQVLRIGLLTLHFFTIQINMYNDYCTYFVPIL